MRLETVEVLGKLLSEPGGSCLPDAGRIHLIKQFAAKRFMDIKVGASSILLFSCHFFYISRIIYGDYSH